MPADRTCVQCLSPLTDVVRSTKLYCSWRCKKQAYRTKKPAATRPPSRYVFDLDSLVGEIQRGETAAFGTVYADPPWRYDNGATRGAAKRHYPTMGVSEIAALPVKHLAADKSLL